MRDSEDGGSRIAIVHNGSPLFSGAAGSGPSEIRRWVIENDYLEAIVAMPEQLFYNTGIASYVWLVTNRKSPERVGKVQLIDAREKYVKMRKSLGEKRREISPDQIAEITSLHGAFEEGDLVKIVPNESFGYRTVVVEQPLRARWEVSADTWAGVAEDKPLAKLDEEASAALVSALDALDEQQFAGEDACGAAMKKVAVGAGIAKPAAPLVKALSARCLVRDPETEPIRNKKGQVVPDPQLRDTENIPLADDVTA
jgi:type I restriction enzyme M protein